MSNDKTTTERPSRFDSPRLDGPRIDLLAENHSPDADAPGDPGWPEPEETWAVQNRRGQISMFGFNDGAEAHARECVINNPLQRRLIKLVPEVIQMPVERPLPEPTWTVQNLRADAGVSAVNFGTDYRSARHRMTQLGRANARLIRFDPVEVIDDPKDGE